MSTEVLVALITLVGTIVGTFGGIVVGSKLVNYRIEQLEKKVDKHNQVIDRVYKLEEITAVHKEDFKVVNHRIEDLEHAQNPTVVISKRKVD